MRRLALLVPLAVLLVGCGGGSDNNSASDGNGDKKGTMDCVISGDESKAELADLEEGKTHEVVVNTSKGSFTFELATDISPCTTARSQGSSRRASTTD